MRALRRSRPRPGRTAWLFPPFWYKLGMKACKPPSAGPRTRPAPGRALHAPCLALALGLAALLLALCPPRPALAAQPVSQEAQPLPQAAELLDTSRADLPEMLERRQVRVLVAPSRTNFTMAQDGSFQGLEHDLAMLLQRSLNKGRTKAQGKVAVVFVPVLVDELLPALLEGRGDLVASGFTVTPAREAQAAFTQPYFDDVREVLVTRADAPPLASLDELAGRVIHVVAGSSHAEHLEALRQDMARRGLPEMRLVQADHVLAIENLLEMLSAGMVDNVVADEHVAKLWAQVLPGVVVHSQVPVARGEHIAWAVRKDNPLLLAAANTALRESARKQTALFQKQFPNRQATAKKLQNPFLKPQTAKLVPHFRKRSDEYGFDWLHMLAQGFQESGLDNGARSPVGAVGVMQVLPATGRFMGFRDIRPAPENIHAGVRYMGLLRDRELADESLDPEQRFYFALASYNAGPTGVRKLRELAARQGLDPNVWFGNVEKTALRCGYQETVQYVRNIRAYYIAYSLGWDIHLRRTKASGR